jgi:hypothetical protein
MRLIHRLLRHRFALSLEGQRKSAGTEDRAWMNGWCRSSPCGRWGRAGGSVQRFSGWDGNSISSRLDWRRAHAINSTITAITRTCHRVARSFIDARHLSNGGARGRGQSLDLEKRRVFQKVSFLEDFSTPGRATSKSN